MALPRQVVNIPISQGIDTFSDRKVIPFQKLSEAHNVCFDKEGSLVKRNGYETLPSELIDGSGLLPVESPTGIHTFGSQLLYTDSENLFGHSPALSKWNLIGRLPAVFSETERISASPRPQRNPVSAQLGGLIWWSWEDDGNIYLSIQDIVSGESLAEASNTYVDVGIRPKLIEFDDNMLLLFVNPNSGFIKVVIVNVNKVSSGDFSEEVFITGISLDYNYDVSVFGDGLKVVYSTDAGTTTTYKRFDTTFDDDFTAVIEQSSNLALDIYHDDAGVAYINMSTSGFGAFIGINNNDTFLTTTFGTWIATQPVVRISGGIEDSTHFVYYEEDAGSQGHRVFRREVHPGSGATIPTFEDRTFVANAAFLCSKPFQFNSSQCVLVSLDHTVDVTHVVVDGLGYPLAKANAQVAGSRTSGSLPSAIVSGSLVSIAVERTELFDNANGQSIDVMAVNSFNVYTDVMSKKALRFHDNLHFPGSIMKSYDGSQVVETGFITRPDVVDVDQDPGGVLEAGTYVYAFTFEWKDKKGQIHESAPSTFEVVTTASDNLKNTFVISALNLTLKQGVRVVGYRSQRRLTDSLDIPLFKFTDFEYINVPNSTGTTVVDSSVDDTALLLGKDLYINGRNLKNVSPPPSTRFTSFNNRLWLINSDSVNSLSFSKQSLEGEPVNFTDEFLINVADDDNEGIKAIKALDNSLIIYKSNNVYLLPGQGPDNLGNTESPYNDPQLITSNVGCSFPDSIISFDQGIMFKTPTKGIWLLDRGFKTSYIGKPVEAFNDLNIVAVEQVSNRNQIRFLTDSETALVYDYSTDQWCTWDNHYAISSTMVDDVYHVLRPNGAILKETLQFTDFNGASIPIKIVTAFFSLAGIMGFKWLYDVYLLGENRGAHKLRIKFGYDYNPNFTNSYDIDASTVLGESVYGAGQYGSGVYGGTWKQEQFGIHVSKPRITSVRVSIEDLQPPGEIEPNEGFSLSYVCLQVGFMASKLKPLPQKQRFTK